MTLDFSFNKYSTLLEAIKNSNYKTLRISDYINTKEDLPEKYIILRHDVDLDPDYQLKFARLESSLGIYTSYYFRTIEKVYKEHVINEIHKMGHEVGYHYEVFTKAKGDAEKATEIFKTEQSEFSKKWHSITACPHGGSFVSSADGYSLSNILKVLPKILMGKSVFSHHVNFNLWEKHSFNEFGLIGDAYSSVDFTDILYLSDTGRSWLEKYKRLDKVVSNINPLFKVKSTDDIIDIIREEKADKIYLLVHFEQWKDTLPSWISWYAAQLIRRTGKKLVFREKMK